jgi:hypothetical protein
MIKVKTFSQDKYSARDLDKEINAFLEQKITVRAINMTSCSTSSSGFIYAQIVYEDGVKEGSHWFYSEPDLFAEPREG